MDRVDEASESGGGEHWEAGGEGRFTFWDEDCVLMDSLRWGETWWGLDRIRTFQGHKELVRHQHALPVATDVYRFFFFALESFVCLIFNVKKNTECLFTVMN